jgi:predicted nucleic acid-binding protein
VDDAVVDASVFVSRLLTDDVHHAPTTAWFHERARASCLFIVPAIMPAEVAGAVSRRVDGRVARRADEHLLRIPSLRVVAIDRRLGERAAALAADLGLRGADATDAAIAEQLKLPLVTCDGEQRTRAARAIAATTPGST